MTFNTGNNVPSTDPRDLYDNAENLDKLVNGADPFYADRLGKLRESWSGMENSFNNAQEGREAAFTLSQADKESRFQAFLVSSGYVSKGDYAADVVLLERNEYVAVDAATTGTSPGLYRPNASATLPLTLTGTWATDKANLVLLGDDVLRQELAADDGASLVGYVRPDVGASRRTISGKLLESVSVLDFDGSDIGAKFNRALQSANGDSYFSDHYKLTIPAGIYDLAEPMVLDGFNKNGIQIQADGVVINNSQDFYSLIMRNCMNPSIRGLHFNMEDNNVAPGCVFLGGNVFWGDFYRLSLLANSANPNFAAVRMKQLNSANINTGNFWNTFTKFWTRRASSAKPNRIPIGVDMIGSQNATIFDKSSFHSCDSAIILQNDTAASTPYLPGSIIINTTAFEESGTAITVKSTSPVVTLRGPSVIGSRFEKLDTVIKFDGITAQPSAPPTFVGNSYVLPITNFEVNPNDLYVNVLDSAVTPSNIPAKQVNFNTVRFRNASGPNPVMDVDAKQAGSIRLIHTNGRVDGFIGQAPGGGMLLHGGEFQILKPKHIKSLSGGDTIGNNFRGTASPASGTTFAVTFTTDEPDANYTPFFSGDGNRKLWWSNKTASGFTINTDTAFAGGPVGWMIIR